MVINGGYMKLRVVISCAICGRDCMKVKNELTGEGGVGYGAMVNGIVTSVCYDHRPAWARNRPFDPPV